MCVWCASTENQQLPPCHPEHLSGCRGYSLRYNYYSNAVSEAMGGSGSAGVQVKTECIDTHTTASCWRWCWFHPEGLCHERNEQNFFIWNSSSHVVYICSHNIHNVHLCPEQQGCPALHSPLISCPMTRCAYQLQGWMIMKWPNRKSALITFKNRWFWRPDGKITSSKTVMLHHLYSVCLSR